MRGRASNRDLKHDDGVLVAIAMNFVRDEAREESIGAEATEEIRQIFEKMVRNGPEENGGRRRIVELVGTARSYDLLRDILTVPDRPPSTVAESEDNPAKPKKRMFWGLAEDIRLIAAVYRCGTSSWDNVASFVGHGRTRIQCLQRWTRVLNPKINKDPWTKEEEDKLMELVESEGDIFSWGQIARKIGTKCDLQCRYKYNKLVAQRSSEERKNNAVASDPPTEKAKEKLDNPVINEFLEKSMVLDDVESWIETDMGKWD